MTHPREKGQLSMQLRRETSASVVTLRYRLARRLPRKPALAAAAAAVLAGAGLTLVSAPAQAAVNLDGSRYDRAAASCWAIKQAKPSSPSGVYWLQTPKLITAQQFYCDQTTDGGGWVLVGRGRDGWSFASNGQGSASTLRTTTSGQAAFAPAALSKTAIDGLLNGTSVDSLADGIRVRRAMNQAGSSYQELRLHTKNTSSWSWAFGGGIALNSVQVNGSNVSSSNLHTRDWRSGNDNAYLRLMTYGMSTHNWRSGFAYGWNVGGANNSTSYLWQYGSEQGALPFAQVWIRPTLSNLTYPSLPASGAPAQTQRALMGNTTTPTGWGVSGTVSGINNEFHLEVQAMEVVGTTVYVGGEFATVRNASGSTQVAQPYLAAFDTTTGAWKPDFRPKLDGQVWEIKALPSGKLIIGGQFTSVNAASNTGGLAAINPTTGAPDASWKADVVYESPTYTRVRGLDVQGDWLYVGGTFTKVTGGVGTSRTAMVRNLARVRLSDGQPDTTWAPKFNNDVFELDASARGDRVYAVGKFTTDSANPSYIQATGMAAVTTSGSGSLVPGFKPYAATGNPGRQYQQTVLELGDYFWVGGSEHNLQRYNRNTFTQTNGFITRDGGDFQALLAVNGVVYASSHSQNYVFSGTNDYLSGMPPKSAYSGVDPYFWIGAWDAATGDYLPEFSLAGLKMRIGSGPWEMVTDSQGCLWFGGDVTQGSSSSWVGGFAKVCPRDSTAPAPPSGLRAVRTSTGVDLSWTASPSSGVTYEVIRDARVIVMPSGTRYTDTGAPAGSTYWVRAVDSAGNRSATTASASS